MQGGKRGGEGAEIRFRVLKVVKNQTWNCVRHNNRLLRWCQRPPSCLLGHPEFFKLGWLSPLLELPLHSTMKNNPTAGDTEGRQVDITRTSGGPKMPGTGLQSDMLKSKKWKADRWRDLHHFISARMELKIHSNFLVLTHLKTRTGKLATHTQPLPRKSVQILHVA